MSHKIYPNLAGVEGFDRDLNYTGIILEDWNDPLNLVPLALAALCLWSGRPRGALGWWALLNCVLIHPMDYICGVMGRGPKYLSDEYAVLDSRYWVLKDPIVMWVTYHEFFVMMPLCFLWYRGIAQGHWNQHFFGALASTFQLMGTIFYFWPAFGDFSSLPAYDWPPIPTNFGCDFETYLKVKYFYIIYIFLNNIWVAVPLYVYYNSYKSLAALLAPKKKEA